jgi:hypothetical protein
MYASLCCCKLALLVLQLTLQLFPAQFSAAYSTGKALVPLPHSVINALENTMSDLGGSLITTAQHQSEKVSCTLCTSACSVG